jgi:hypothetical protein
MPRIQLHIYRDPGQVEVFLNTKRKDNGNEKRAAIIDSETIVTQRRQYSLKSAEAYLKRILDK